MTIKLFSNVTGVVNANSTQSTVTLNLNGHTITGNGLDAVLQVGLGSTLTLTDVSGNTGKIQGGSIGIEVQSGTLVMNGGTITGNNGTYGGGVSLTGATFTMNDGVISGNTASSYGGGVYVDQGSSFTMTDGTISGNTAANGGGVYVETQGSNSGRFTMTGGSIIGNTADTDAGGVYTTTVNLGSADSSQNKVITITGNTLNGTACNVKGIKTSTSVSDGIGGGINMQAQLAVGSSIGITAPKATMTGEVATTATYFTSGWDKSWDRSVFVPDDSSATLGINNGNSQLLLK